MESKKGEPQRKQKKKMPKFKMCDINPTILFYFFGYN